MTRREKASPRGWSLVLRSKPPPPMPTAAERNSDESPADESATVEHTVIDRELAGQIAKELARNAGMGWAAANDSSPPLDPDFADKTRVEQAPDFDAMRAQEEATDHEEEQPWVEDDQDAQEKYEVQDDTETGEDSPPNENVRAALERNVSVSPIVDPLVAQRLPTRHARPARPPQKKDDSGVIATQRAPSPIAKALASPASVVAPASAVPTVAEPARNGRRDHGGLRALPPSKTAPVRALSPTPRLSLGEPGEEIERMLREELFDDEATSDERGRSSKASTLSHVARRAETVSTHLPRWLSITDSASKLIPVVLGVFVLVFTLVVAVKMIVGINKRDAEFVSLRFLAVGTPLPQSAEVSGPLPMITLETIPEGINIVLDRKIIGPTPITFEMPMRAMQIGVELNSPYYETFITEASKGESGEFRVKAKLIPRKR